MIILYLLNKLNENLWPANLNNRTYLVDIQNKPATYFEVGFMDYMEYYKECYLILLSPYTVPMFPEMHHAYQPSDVSSDGSWVQHIYAACHRVSSNISTDRMSL